ncbi:type IX secretion system membrane protein PorP/SprF [Maribacter sp. 2307UL18-2]|uniref:PorP/SprF family type IX secretion system membrane protein n=1 Tax=Maribacter sp. 2307UL18-2 TaxID=3386274 RepID=UPI0039BD0A83
MKDQLKYIIVIITVLSSCLAWTQQDPQFTQYMYNTISVNPGYAGSRGHLSILGMYRTQWVGINGAPESQVLAIDGPVGRNVGLGLVIANDQLGPSNETFLDANFSYTIRLTNETKKLSFGLKGGGRLLNVDFSKGSFENPDIAFQTNINSKFLPTIGAGVYYHSEKSYLGLAIPNFFEAEHYDSEELNISTERLHYFLIGGTVFDMSADLKLKPAFFVKWVPGSPVIADVSLNALIKETLSLGLAYRWDDSFSALAGLQVSPRLKIGYAHDFTTTDLRNYNFGTHEIFLRFEFKSEERKFKSPRFY